MENLKNHTWPFYLNFLKFNFSSKLQFVDLTGFLDVLGLAELKICSWLFL